MQQPDRVRVARLHAAQSGVRISSVADGRSRDVAGRRDRATAPSRTCPRSLRRTGTRICSCGATPPTDNGSPITLRRTDCASPRVSTMDRCSRSRRDTPAIYTAAMTGFFPREHDAEWSWRWMGADAAWTIVNTSAQPIVATLDLDMSAFHRRAPHGAAARRTPGADARRRAIAPHLPDRSRSP